MSVSPTPNDRPDGYFILKYIVPVVIMLCSLMVAVDLAHVFWYLSPLLLILTILIFLLLVLLVVNVLLQREDRSNGSESTRPDVTPPIAPEFGGYKAAKRAIPSIPRPLARGIGSIFVQLGICVLTIVLTMICIYGRDGGPSLIGATATINLSTLDTDGRTLVAATDKLQAQPDEASMVYAPLPYGTTVRILRISDDGRWYFVQELINGSTKRAPQTILRGWVRRSSSRIE